MTAPKPPSWNDIRTKAAVFVREWQGETRERGEAQTFWSEFLDIFGVVRRRVAVFEKRAERASTGGKGFIDLFWPGVLIAEHKSAGKDLDSAEGQALDYLDDIADHELPRYVLSSDFQRIRILDLLDPEHQSAFTFPITDLVEQIDRFGFIAGYSQRQFGSVDEAQASIDAARLMASLYEELARTGYDDDQAAIYLTRILFLMFGDDTGMWEKDLFGGFLRERTRDDGSDLGPQLALLFQVADRPVGKRAANLDEVLQRFPYVNGGLFHDRLDIPSFDRASREVMLSCCRFDWGDISPAVFGSMFQAVNDKEVRRKLGEHYTTEENILKVIRPLFLDDLRDRFGKAYNNQGELTKLLNTIAQQRYLDPACGCGNFLVVAYREMRTLELDILKRKRELGEDTQLALDGSIGLKVSLDQFHGIEIAHWPARIAETAMFLVDHQANQRLEIELGTPPERLPISETAHIHHGNAIRIKWEEHIPPSSSVLIFGNPPFKGKQDLTSDQKADLELAWGTAYSGTFDYVTAWYAKALDYFRKVDGRWSFVSTNSICQGEAVAPLWRHILGGRWQVAFAHRPFLWTSEAPDAAAVHCVIVGVARKKSDIVRLFDYEGFKTTVRELHPGRVNPYLVDGPDVLVTGRSRPLTDLPEPMYGSMANDGKNLLIKAVDVDRFKADPRAAKYLRRFIGARELLYGEEKWCLWLVDAKPGDIAASSLLKERVDAVRRHRETSKRPETRKLAATPQLFGEIRQPHDSYLAIPRHVSWNRRYFPVARFDSDVICGDHNFLAPDADGFLFGLLSSSLFLAWMHLVGGRIRADPRFSKSPVWNNFPLPPVSDKDRQKIIDAGQQVLEARALHPDWSLVDHYNPLAMTPELLRAHRALDRVLDRVLGSRTPLDTQLAQQTALFRAYVARINEGALIKSSGSRSRTRRKTG